jgi:hypothetical protein
MDFLKNLGKRLGYFIFGLVMTAVGILLIILEFSGGPDQWYRHTSYYPFGALALGIGGILVAFDKKKDEVKEKKEES